MWGINCQYYEKVDIAQSVRRKMQANKKRRTGTLASGWKSLKSPSETQKVTEKTNGCPCPSTCLLPRDLRGCSCREVLQSKEGMLWPSDVVREANSGNPESVQNITKGCIDD